MSRQGGRSIAAGKGSCEENTASGSPAASAWANTVADENQAVAQATQGISPEAAALLQKADRLLESS